MYNQVFWALSHVYAALVNRIFVQLHVNWLPPNHSNQPAENRSVCIPRNTANAVFSLLREYSSSLTLILILILLQKFAEANNFISIFCWNKSISFANYSLKCSLIMIFYNWFVKISTVLQMSFFCFRQCNNNPILCLRH